MKFTFIVGVNEKHKVAYDFNKFWGGTTIKVDDEEILKTTQLFKQTFKSEQPPTEFEVGDKEKHKVSIKVTMPLLYAGFRPCKYEVFVNGKLLNTYNGY